MTTRLEQRQLRAAIDLEIGVGLPHAVDVADLPGKIENHIVIAHQVVHGALLADVGDVDLEAVFDAVDVEQVPAVVADE